MLRSKEIILADSRGLYLGEMPATGMHCHPCPVVLLGLSGRFGLALEGRGQTSAHSAVIGPGVRHVFDPLGETIATLYLEPDDPATRALLPLLAAHGGVMLDTCSPVRSKSFTNARLRAFDLDALLPHPLPAAAGLEPRVQRALQAMRGQAGTRLARADVAALTHLSESRFNHLFREQTGISFRDYRLWCQLRSAMASMRAHTRLTDAALDGAFVDSTHFSRRFRQTFAMKPSSVLHPTTRVVVRP